MKLPENHDNLRQEFAVDVLNYLMELANRFDVNLAKPISRSTRSAIIGGK